MKKWVALFSQTGTEIFNLIEDLAIKPDRIIINNSDLTNVNSKLLNKYFDVLWVVPNKPSIEEYDTFLDESTIVTMHGWLRIVPPAICERYKIYNLHPAPLTRYPFLKSKDPQKRCIEQDLEYGGNTLHECSSELDSGKIIYEDEVRIRGYSVDVAYDAIYASAFKLWKKFLINEFTRS